jgi:ATP-dependent Zn protease
LKTGEKMMTEAEASAYMQRRSCTPKNRRSAAYHEASHAAILRDHGVKVVEVSIEWKFGGFGPGALGRTARAVDYSLFERVEVETRNALAGRIGEQIARGLRPAMRLKSYLGTDREGIEHGLKRLIGFRCDETRAAWLRLQWLITRDVLSTRWSEVEKIAAALLERERLTGEEIERLLKVEAKEKK